MNYTEIEGNLITLAKEGKFDVIAHGCNCFCTMGAGLAPQMAKAFGCDRFVIEGESYKGDITKLGNIDYEVRKAPLWLTSKISFEGDGKLLTVVNAYTQYSYDVKTKPFDYEAFTLCMRKMNHVFKGKHIGLPQIGSHLAGGDWNIIKDIIQKEFKDCTVTVVIFKP